MEIDLRGMDAAALKADMKTIWHESVDAANMLENPNCVRIAPGSAVEVKDGLLCTCILRHSVNLIEIG